MMLVVFSENSSSLRGAVNTSNLVLHLLREKAQRQTHRWNDVRKHGAPKHRHQRAVEVRYFDCVYDHCVFQHRVGVKYARHVFFS